MQPLNDERKRAQERLEMVEVFESLRGGRMPNNNQLVEFIDRLMQNPSIETRKHLMSRDGQRLLEDLRELLRSLQKTIQTKNRDQLFQSLYYHLHCMNPSVDKNGINIDVTGGKSKEELKQEAQGGANAIIKIGRLILLHEGFRSRVDELLMIVQSLFGEHAESAGQNIQELGNKINEQMQEIGGQMQDLNDPEKQRDVAKKLKETDYKQKLNENKPDLEAHKAKAKEYGSKTQSSFRERMPPEKIDETIRHLKSILAEVQGKEDYQQAMDTIFRLFDSWSNRLTEAGQASQGHAAEATQQVRSDPNWTAAEQEIKTILEDWAQGKSLDPVIRAFHHIAVSIKEDPEVHKRYQEVADYIRRLLREPGYLQDDKSTQDGRELVQRAREVTQERHTKEFNELNEEAKSFFKAIEQDPMAQELNDRVRQIHNDLWFDREGNATFKPYLLNDMRLTLLPAALEMIKFIPVPRIEYSDEGFDVAVENVVLTGTTLLPDVFEMKMENYLKFSPRTNITNANQQSLFVKMDQIQTVVNDVVFYYKRKSGFPRLSDRGVASLIIDGRGISVSARILSDTNDQRHTFRVTQCNCRVNKLDIKVHDSRHDLLYKTVHPLMVRILKRQIARAVEQKVVESLETADQYLTSTLLRLHQESVAKA
ncbi:hypothetical protein BCR43DRAFT_437417, partial [Syncephalastrum racemosum]